MKLDKYLFCVCVGVIVGIQDVAIARNIEHFVISSTRAKIGSRLLEPSDGLAGDDHLNILSGGKVKVICRNGTEAIFTISADVRSKCPSSTSSQTRQNQPWWQELFDAWRNRNEPSIAPARNGMTDVPYVLSPRKSKILTTRPEIRWNLVEGVKSYTIELSGASVDTISWQKTVEEVNFQYPLEQPALIPGETYEIKISTNNFIASTEDGQKVIIEVLDIAKQQEFFGLLEQLRQLDFSSETEILLESLLYAEFELYSQAIAILSAYIQENPAALELRERLAELYSEVGLPWEARQEYAAIEGRSQGDITEIRYRTLQVLAAFAEVNREELLAEEYRAESQQIAQQLGL